jgi:hypothetical protein
MSVEKSEERWVEKVRELEAEVERLKEICRRRSSTIVKLLEERIEYRAGK